MLFKVTVWAITFILQVISLASADEISYVSVKSGSYLADDINSVSDLISQANEENPLVIFQFETFPAVPEFLPSEGNLPFLYKFFNYDVTKVLQEGSSFDIDNERAEVFTLTEVPSTASELLYDYHHEGKSVILFDFQRAEYDISVLDEFLESAYLFLEDSLDNLGTVVLTTENSGSFNTVVSSKARSEKSRDDKGTTPIGGDEDILSDIWTEGLLMCLIVSLLLVAVLVVAISWMSSVNISYGALERSTNPLKKTK